MNGKTYCAILASYCEPRAPVLRLLPRLEKLFECTVREVRGPLESVYREALRTPEAQSADVLIWLSPLLSTTAGAVGLLLDSFEDTQPMAVVSAVTLPPEAARLGEWRPNFTLEDPNLGRIAVAGETSGLIRCKRVSLDFAVSRVLHPDYVDHGHVSSDPATRLYLDTRVVGGVVCEFPVYPHHVAEVKR